MDRETMAKIKAQLKRGQLAGFSASGKLGSNEVKIINLDNIKTETENKEGK